MENAISDRVYNYSKCTEPEYLQSLAFLTNPARTGMNIFALALPPRRERSGYLRQSNPIWAVGLDDSQKIATPQAAVNETRCDSFSRNPIFRYDFHYSSKHDRKTASAKPDEYPGVLIFAYLTTVSILARSDLTQLTRYWAKQKNERDPA